MQMTGGPKTLNSKSPETQTLKFPMPQEFWHNVVQHNSSLFTVWNMPMKSPKPKPLTHRVPGVVPLPQAPTRHESKKLTKLFRGGLALRGVGVPCSKGYIGVGLWFWGSVFRILGFLRQTLLMKQLAPA